MAQGPHCQPGDPASVLDVRELPPRLRHARIFEALEALAPGQALTLVNDHDPKPLYYQLQAEQPGRFGWRYLDEGPEVWRVEVRKATPPAGGTTGRGEAAARPALLQALPDSRQVPLDVREQIRRGEEPFARIMAAVKALGEDQVLVLRAPFEPAPLYGVLGQRGFAHWTESRAPDDWSVWFYREPARRPAASATGGSGRPAGAETIRLDVRGLEPPQPMVRVLEQIEALAPGQRLEVLHERRPVFLYPQLDERGFLHETDEPEPGIVRIVIRRGDGGT